MLIIHRWSTPRASLAPVRWAIYYLAVDELFDGRPPCAPPGIDGNCAVSGTEPLNGADSNAAIFADQPPLPQTEDLWKKVVVDTWTGLSISNACDNFSEEVFAANVTDRWAQRWLRDEAGGAAWVTNLGFSTPLFFVPERACRADDPRPIITLTGLVDGQNVLESPLEIRGMITATQNFKYYRIEWGRGSDPSVWNVLVDNVSTPQETPDLLYEWDLRDVEPCILTLRIFMRSTEYTYAEKLFRLNIHR